MKYLLALVALSLATLAPAHFVWATVDPGGKRLRLEVAESPGESIVPMLGQMIGSIHAIGAGKLVEENHQVVAPLNAPAGGVDLLYGVHGDFLVHWWAKGASSLASAGEPLGQTVEILVRAGKGDLIAIVTKNGKPAPNAEVEIYLPGRKPIQRKSGGDGTVRFPLAKAGVLAIGAIVHNPIAGDYKGAHYNESRDYCSLTIRL